MSTVLCLKNNIDAYLEKHLEVEKPKILSDAIRYSTLGGGKRIRPILCIAGFAACGGRGSFILPVACAIELVHTFSLIHDDLPCMDNDDYRRGKLTCHKVFGEDIAVLAGDALLTMAFEWIASAKNVSDKKKTVIIKELSRCIGINGIIGGQVMDLRTNKNNPPVNIIKSIYLKKTAALITTSVRIGAIAGGASKKQLSLLTNYGNNLGFAFQIIDDLLDLSQDSKKEINYSAIVGREKTVKLARRLTKHAINSIKPFGKKSKLLEDIINLVINQIQQTP